MKKITKKIAHSLFISLFITIPFYCTNKPSIAIIGTGYVGLVSGAGLAKLGNKVICCDIDEQKIEALNKGTIPIYEPGLAELVADAVSTGSLSFTTDIAQAVRDAIIIIIAVGTPMSHDGCADLSYIKAAVKTIAKNSEGYKIICTKSTVPIGTGHWIKQLLLEDGVNLENIDVASNPEFLREGNAIDDFLHPDRIVLGIESDRAKNYLCAMYQPLITAGTPCVITNLVTAESIKYAANSFLATKLSFINEIANLCDATGADVKTLTYAIGLDKRISPHFLNPGPGFGGSCFPKDCQALIRTAEHYNTTLAVIDTALKVNEQQKKRPIEKLLSLLNDNVSGKKIAVLGLAFKGNTDDIRYSPAITTIEYLLEHGADVHVYDPAAMNNTRAVFPTITYCSSAYEATQNADAMIIMTEWDEFNNLDLKQISVCMKQRILVDTRNILDKEQLKNLRFTFSMFGTH